MLLVHTGKNRKYFIKSVTLELDLKMGSRTATGGGEKGERAKNSVDMEGWKCFCALKKLLPVCRLYSRKEADCGPGGSGLCDSLTASGSTLTVTHHQRHIRHDLHALSLILIHKMIIRIC